MDSLDLSVVPFLGQHLPPSLQKTIADSNKNFGWTIAQSQSDFKGEHTEYYVMLKQETVVGYIGLHRVLDEATINMVYILPEYRKMGLATQLLEFVLEQLAFRQVQHIFLEVRASNIAAQCLYKKLNFQTLVTRKNYYQNPNEDAFIMQLSLAERREQENA